MLTFQRSDGNLDSVNNVSTTFTLASTQYTVALGASAAKQAAVSMVGPHTYGTIKKAIEQALGDTVCSKPATATRTIRVATEEFVTKTVKYQMQQVPVSKMLAFGSQSNWVQIVG